MIVILIRVPTITVAILYSLVMLATVVVLITAVPIPVLVIIVVIQTIVVQGTHALVISVRHFGEQMMSVGQQTNVQGQIGAMTIHAFQTFAKRGFIIVWLLLIIAGTM